MATEPPPAAGSATARGLIGAVRRDLAAARYAARGALAEARAARAASQVQLDAVHQGASARRAALDAARDEAGARARTRWEGESAGSIAALGELADAAAPGCAGVPFGRWGSDLPRAGDPPCDPPLLRIGTVSDGIAALIPLLDAAHLAVHAGAGRTDLSAADGLIGGLLLRALAVVAPGALRITVYDPGQLGGALAGLAPLAGAGLVSYLGPGGLSPLLDELVEHIRRVNENVLAGAYPSLAALAAATGRRPEPWRVAVLLADSATELTEAQRLQLERIVRTGIAAGVHVISRGIELPHSDTGTAVERIDVGKTSARTSLTGPLAVKLDRPPRPNLLTSVCKTLAEQVTAGPPPVPFAALLPERLWAESGQHSLRAPIGEGTDGRLVELTLGDDPPHALIGGPSGSGKTNLLYAWLAALAARYRPGEMELYLLDFKEGVSFARFAPGVRDPSWLPQVRLVGVNVNADREFGLALLRHLGDELKRRAAAAKRHEVSKLAELRQEDPDGHWPRIVAVIDEFQVLLGARDTVTSEAVQLLEDLARRGRSQGIHLVLASQDVSGIEALWGRAGLIAQFTLRVALPKARRILADNNLAAELIPRHHAVVNAESGTPAANVVVRLPNSGDRDTWGNVQHQLWSRRPEGSDSPRIFDGDALPLFPLLPPPRPASELAQHGAVALLGEHIDVGGRPATLRLNRAPGRNLAVVGTAAADACAVLTSAGLALGQQYEPGTARFSVICLDSDAEEAAKSLHAALPEADWHDQSTVPDLLHGLTQASPGDPEVPHFLLGFAMDAGPGGRAEPMRHLLAEGPQRRTHVLGWWRTAARLREDLGGIGARCDAIGAWVALDVHGPELAPFYPQPGGPAWHPRPRRALYFDRAVHHRAEIIIPYAMTP